MGIKRPHTLMDQTLPPLARIILGGLTLLVLILSILYPLYDKDGKIDEK